MTLALAILALLAVLRAATPIAYAALGGLLSELSGKINVALEGLMLVAAFTGVIAAIHPPPGLPPVLLPWWGLMAGLLAALLLALLLAVLHLECGADLIVAVIALKDRKSVV